MNIGQKTKTSVENKMKARMMLTKIFSTNNRVEELLATLTNAVNGLLFEKLSYDLWHSFFEAFKEIMKMNVMDKEFVIDFMRALEHANIEFKDVYEEQDYWDSLVELGAMYEELTIGYER